MRSEPSRPLCTVQCRTLSSDPTIKSIATDIPSISDWIVMRGRFYDKILTNNVYSKMVSIHKRHIAKPITSITNKLPVCYSLSWLMHGY